MAKKITSLRQPTKLTTRWLLAEERLRNGDLQGALAQFESLAADGYVEAYAEIGNVLEIRGDGPQDYERALHWYEKAIESIDDLDAHTGAGRLYYNGQGVPRDDEKAFKHLLKAEPRGKPMSLILLGAMYHLGRGTQTDLDRAYSLYRAAADQGYVLAMQYLRHLEYQRGNYLAALRWRIKTLLATLRIGLRDSEDPRLTT